MTRRLLVVSNRLPIVLERKQNRMDPETGVGRAGERAGAGALPPRRPVDRLAGPAPGERGRVGEGAGRGLPRARLRARPGPDLRGRGEGVLRGVLERHPLAPVPRPARPVRLPALLLVHLPDGEPEVRRLRAGAQRRGRLHLGAGLPAHPRRLLHPGEDGGAPDRVLPPHPVPAAGHLPEAPLARPDPAGPAGLRPDRLPDAARQPQLRGLPGAPAARGGDRGRRSRHPRPAGLADDLGRAPSRSASTRPPTRTPRGPRRSRPGSWTCGARSARSR